MPKKAPERAGQGIGLEARPKCAAGHLDRDSGAVLAFRALVVIQVIQLLVFQVIQETLLQALAVIAAIQVFQALAVILVLAVFQAIQV